MAFLRLITLITLAVIPVVRAATQYQVIVGGPGVLKFNPEFVTANPGDTVVFSFRQENHTATQSTLDSPCELADGGFDSGFIPVAANNTDGPFPAAQFTVEDTNPVWVFCRQANHCQQGMVFAINPGNQFTTFQANAMGNGTANSSTSSGTVSATASASASSSLNSTSFISSFTSSSPSPSSVNTSDTASVVTVTATVTASANAQASSFSSTSSSASPPTSTSSDHVVVVGGNGQLTYSPSNITADIGDTVTFRFVQANHTVTQSSFADPCQSLTETSTNGQVGFDSGFMPVAANSSDFPTYTIQINDTTPVWVYCKQTNPKSHCGAGMVFSVNAVESGSNNFATFQSKAVQSNGTTSGTTTANDATLMAPSRIVVTWTLIVCGFVGLLL